jgi:hypothetical protein
MPQRRRPDELDHHDLSAHSQHHFRIYGGEEIRLMDLRGRYGAPDPDVTIAFKNVRLSGRVSTLRGFADTLAGILMETLVHRDEIECYEVETVERRRPIVGPSAIVPRSER